MSETSNRLISSFSTSDHAILTDLLQPVTLTHKTILFEASKHITKVYFPTTAIISLVVALSNGEIIETAMIGRDGVVGASAALDDEISMSRAVVQLTGDALWCHVEELKSAAFQSHSLLSGLIHHEQAVFAQAQQSTACMAAHDVEQRLCRWLLRAADLSETDTLHFTQEFLAEMLGVRRTSVTTAAHTLQAAGMISYSRGKIKILDLHALRDASCECYEAVNRHYAGLFGRETH